MPGLKIHYRSVCASKHKSLGKFGFFFLVLFFPLHLYSTNLQNITNFGAENSFPAQSSACGEYCWAGLAFQSNFDNNCQHALKFVSITISLKVHKNVESINCVILWDTTYDTEGEKLQTPKPTNARKAIL